MTCIVGIEHGKRVLMGGDGQASWPNMKSTNANPKVFRKRGILFGCCGSIRFAQIIEHALKNPFVPPDRDDDIYPWLVAVLVPEVRKCLKDEGHDEGDTCLIAVRGQLWEPSSDFSVFRHARGYAAAGSGRDYALGSVFTSMNFMAANSRNGVERAIRRAIAVAGTFSPSVGTDATVLST